MGYKIFDTLIQISYILYKISDTMHNKYLKGLQASRFTIYSRYMISNLIYQISYIIYKISDILYQISYINKIFYMPIKIS